jgi:hypothetical protein
MSVGDQAAEIQTEKETELMRTYFLACAALFLGAPIFGQQPQTGSGTPAKPADQAELTNLLDAKIKAEWEAIKQKNQKALGDLLSEEYVGVEADSEGERFKWKAKSELQESAVTDYTLSFLKVVPLCSDAAFARYEVFIKFPPKSIVKFEKLLVGEVWIKRDDKWQLLRHQETKVK